MRRIGALIAIVILVMAFFFWKYIQDRPEFVLYGFENNYHKSYFMIYGAIDGSELEYIEDRYYVRLKEVQDFGIARVRNNVPTTEYVHYFLDLNEEVSIYRKDQFPANGIHYFDDSKLENKDVKGLISFYIGDTTNTFISERHMAIRDSIIQYLK